MNTMYTARHNEPDNTINNIQQPNNLEVNANGKTTSSKYNRAREHLYPTTTNNNPARILQAT